MVFPQVTEGRRTDALKTAGQSQRSGNALIILKTPVTDTAEAPRQLNFRNNSRRGQPGACLGRNYCRTGIKFIILNGSNTVADRKTVGAAGFG